MGGKPRENKQPPAMISSAAKQRIGDLVVQQRDISELKTDPKNPRTHNKDQINQLVQSIAKFGYLQPILVDEDNNVIAGHGRLEAAKLLGFGCVPVIEICGLTSAEKRALALADNKIPQNAGWDDELLRNALEDISIEAEEMLGVIGFDPPEIDMILSDSQPANNADDNLPELPKDRPTSMVGDLFLIGNGHRLFVGDVRGPASVEQLLDDDEEAHIVISDPPYNLSAASIGGRGKNRHPNFMTAAGEMSAVEFVAFLYEVFRICKLYSVLGSLHYHFIDWRHIEAMLAAGKRAYSELLNVCVWAKTNGGMGSHYRSAHELVFVFKRGTAPHQNMVQLGKYGRNRTNVWTYPGASSFHKGRDEDLANHPTVKPVAMIMAILRDSSKRGDIVLDPFGGSGTTLIAAELTGRRARLVEIDPRYADVIIRRWQQRTGKEVRHAGSGMTFEELTLARRGASNARL